MIGFGNLPTNPAVFAQKTFHWVDTVSMNTRQPRHQVRRRGAARPRQLRLRRAAPGHPLLQHPRLRDGRGPVGRHPRHQPSHRPDRAEHPELPLLGERRVLPGRLEDPLEPHAQPRAPARVVRPADRGERPVDEHDPRTGRTTSSSRSRRRRSGGSIRSCRTTSTTSRRGSASRGIRGATAGSSIRGGWGIAYERLFNNSITNIRFNPPDYSFTVASPVFVGGARRLPIAYGPRNPDGTVRNEPITITGPNTNIGVAGRPRDRRQHHRVEPAVRDLAAVAARARSEHEGRVHATTGSSAARPSCVGNMVLEANYVGNIGRNFGRLVDYNTVRGDLFDGRLDRLNPSFGGINFRAMLAHTEYHGAQFQLNKRFSKGYSVAGRRTRSARRWTTARTCRSPAGRSTRATSSSSGGRRTSTCGTGSSRTGCGSCRSSGTRPA